MEEVYSNYLNLKSSLSLIITEGDDILIKEKLILNNLKNGNEPSIEIRRELITELLSSLSNQQEQKQKQQQQREEEQLDSINSTSNNDNITINNTLSEEDLLTKLTILKHLGRSPAGSEELSRNKGLKILLSYSGLTRISNRPLLSYSKGTTLSETDPLFPYESEALRCLCNCLMLHPTARELFPELVLENLDWIKGMISLLAVDDAGFLAGRLLFLLTSQQSDSIVTMSEEGQVVKALQEYAERYLTTLQSSFASTLTQGSIPTRADTLREHFKMAYNLMLQYGRHPSLFPSNNAFIPSTPTPTITNSTPPPPPPPLSSSIGSIATLSSSTSISNESPSISLIPPTPRDQIMHLDTSMPSSTSKSTSTSTSTSLISPNEDSSSNFESGYISDSRTDSSSTEGGRVSGGGGGGGGDSNSSRPVSPSISSDRSDHSHSSSKSFSTKGVEKEIGKGKGKEKDKEKSKRRFWKSGRSNSNSAAKGERPTLIGSTTHNESSQTITPTTTTTKPPGLLTKLKDVVTGSPSSSHAKLPSPSTPSTPSIPLPTTTTTTTSSNSTSNSNNFESTPTGELSLQATEYFLPLFQPYLYLSCLLPLGSDPKDPSPLLRGALNTLLNFPIELESTTSFNPTSSWLQSVPFSISYYPTLDPLPSKLLEILSKTCEAQFPTNVRPEGIKFLPAHPDELIPRGTGESGKAEEILGPIMLLLRKVTMLTRVAEGMKEILLPYDIDRTIPLERRTDLIGHLIRLLSSILLPNTAYGVGEFIYNLCDRDPTILCQQIGYGNASGFLQNRGELIPPPPSSSNSTSIPFNNATIAVPIMDPPPSRSRPGTPTYSNIPLPASGGSTSTTTTTTTTTSSKRNSFISTPSALKRKSLNNNVKTGQQSPLSSTSVLPPTTSSSSSSSPSNQERIINPITGAYYDAHSPTSSSTLALQEEAEMTLEEKEKESERLFVLFERMNRSGSAMRVENPIGKAREEGKFVETKEERERELREGEERDRREEEEVERELKAYKDRRGGK